MNNKVLTAIETASQLTIKPANLPVGLFYHVGVDNATPYNICGGMQDNYSWCGPSQVRGSAGIAGFHWATVQGGDGFVVLQDPTDYRIAFSESQDGNIARGDRVTGETIGVRPTAAPGEPALRWHWDTPIALSPHDPKVVWAAANKVFRSSDRGLSWVAVSNDLTNEANRDEIANPNVVKPGQEPKIPNLKSFTAAQITAARKEGRNWRAYNK